MEKSRTLSNGHFSHYLVEITDDKLMQPSEFFDSLIQGLVGFITFDVLISPAILLAGYYLGALVLPVFIYRYVSRNIKKMPSLNLPKVEIAAAKLPVKALPKWTFILAFIAFEIFWRMFFEFLIAYFQIREALLSIYVTG